MNQPRATASTHDDTTPPRTDEGASAADEALEVADHDVHALGDGEHDDAPAHFDEMPATQPERPALPAVAAARASREVQELRAFVDATARKLPAWDNLAHIEAFVAAVERARAPLSSLHEPVARRVVAASLVRLMPPSMRPTRPIAFELPEDVALRADSDFVLAAGDLPEVHASYSAHLASADLVTTLLQPGRHVALLAPRAVSPSVEPAGNALLVRGDGHESGSVVGGPPRLRCTALHSDGRTSSTRVVRGQPEPILVDTSVLSSWLLSAGPDARGLDLRNADDRALLLVFCSLLKAAGLWERLAVEGDEKSRADVVRGCIEAASEAVGLFCADPMELRFTLPIDDDKAMPGGKVGGWGHRAAGLLRGLQIDGLPLCVEVEARERSGMRELLWLDAVLAPGFVGGACTTAAQTRALCRLLTSVLAPMGALPMSGARDQRGVVVQLIGTRDGMPFLDAPLWCHNNGVVELRAAWKAGMGRALPEPKGALAHDIAALPAWLSMFLHASPSSSSIGTSPHFLDDSGAAGERT